MRLPVWLVLLVGSLVVLFGIYRVWISFRSAEDEETARARGGLYGRGRRSHLIIGLLYIALGGLLVASAFGVKPPWLR